MVMRKGPFEHLNIIGVKCLPGLGIEKLSSKLGLLSSLPDSKVQRSLHNTTMKFNY